MGHWTFIVCWIRSGSCSIDRKREKEKDEMADFFEELGKKISDVAIDLGKKTEDTIEIQKLKSDIRALKRANERDQLDIGRMVYEKFSNGEISDIDYVAVCESIEKRDEEIAKLTEEIERIRGTV